MVKNGQFQVSQAPQVANKQKLIQIIPAVIIQLNFHYC